MGLFDFFSKDKKDTLEKGLEKSRQGIFQKLAKLVTGKSQIDDEFLDELEEILITSDVGVETTLKIIERIQSRASKEKYSNVQELNLLLKEEIISMIVGNEENQKASDIIPSDKKPYVLLIVGVNGVGKTTTIGKIAYNLHNEGLKVVLGAGDTFRAAAVDQLKLWG
ncbi:MAG: signal recognition particle receptor subunit alpha, partial [Cytophagales bacterium]